MQFLWHVLGLKYKMTFFHSFFHGIWVYIDAMLNDKVIYKYFTEKCLVKYY